MEPKNLENNIKIIPDNILAESFVFQFTPLGENDPVAQMKMLAADYLVLQHIPTSTETLNMISDKSDSYWTSRNLDTILEYLEGNNVAVTPLFFPQLNDTPEYIFLFEKK